MRLGLSEILRPQAARVVLEASRKRDNHERCFAVVEQFMEAFDKARKYDVNIAVAVCIIPDEVRTNCRTESRVSDAIDAGLTRQEKESRMRGQLELFETFDPEQYKLSPDFRRQLKARSMRYNIPLQIIQESTLRLSDTIEFGERPLTRLSDSRRSRPIDVETGYLQKLTGRARTSLRGCQPFEEPLGRRDRAGIR
jgi:hypothetical protein